MEYPAELLLKADDFAVKQSLCGLIFETTPTYAKIVNGTPKLKHIFKLSQELTTTKDQLVTSRGIEPRFDP